MVAKVTLSEFFLCIRKYGMKLVRVILRKTKCCLNWSKNALVFTEGRLRKLANTKQICNILMLKLKLKPAASFLLWVNSQLYPGFVDSINIFFNFNY